MITLILNSIICIYIGLFSFNCFRLRLKGWLFLSGIFWLILAILGNILLPGLSGLFKPTNIYLIPFYIFLASIFWRKKISFLAPTSYLSTLATSNKFQYAAQAIWLILIFFLGKWMPFQASIIFYLIEMILWQPLFWIGSQWLLMYLLHLNHKEIKRKLSSQEILLLTMLWQFFYVYLKLQRIV